MTKFKENDVVIVTDGEFVGETGRILDDEGPVRWVMLFSTEVVITIHEHLLQPYKVKTNQ